MATLKDKPVESSQIDRLEPLIPSTVLDEASQRVFLISLFLLIQSWKLYDVILIRSDSSFDGIELTSLNRFSFVVKYAIIDGLFVWILPILNIQYLRFSALKTLLLTLALNATTFFLVSNATAPFLSTVVLPVYNQIFQHRELTIGGESVNTNNLIDINSHFKGKLTINYLPDSSAKFNPFHFDGICLENLMVIQMPIEFNTSTKIGHLQLQHVNDRNQVNYIDYSGYKLNRLIRKDYSHLSKYKEYSTNQNIFYMEVPIKDPGKYKISKIVDTKNNGIRTYKSEFVIAQCPLAQFVYPRGFDTAKNYKCFGKNIGDSDMNLPFLKTTGVFPVSVNVQIKKNGKVYKTVNITNSQLETQATDLSWLKAYDMTRNSLEQEILHHPDILAQAGEGLLEFQLLDITDYLGNSKRYNPHYKDKDILFTYELKQSQKLTMKDSDRHNSELVIDGTKTLKIISDDHLNEDIFPISVTISYVNINDSISNGNITKTFSTPIELQHGIEIDQPGIYTLISGTTKYCPCEIESNEVKITLASPPELSLKSNPIIDKCLGTTGFNFDFDLKGKPPFQIDYRVYQNQTNGVLKPVHGEHGTVTRSLRTNNKKYSFEFKPPTEGNYVLKFNSVRDANCPKGVQLDENTYTYLTYFKQVSRVSFFENGRGRHILKKTCLGDSVKIPLYFKGNGPYSFNYDIIDLTTGEKLIPTVKIKDVSSYIIEVPTNIESTKYEVKVSSILDKFSCAAIMDKAEKFTVSGRSEIPEILLESKVDHYEIIEGGSVEIPLNIKSSVGRSSSDRIGYKIVDLKDPTKVQTRVLDRKTLVAKEEGIYSLVSFENDGCPGAVSKKERSIKVTYLPKPKLSVSSTNVMRQHLTEQELHLRPVCQNCDQPLKLQLVGKKPFVVEYEVKLPSGKVENRLMNVEKNEVEIKLSTNEAGRYEHRFKGIYDQSYTKAKSRYLQNQLQTVRYNVNVLPNGIFTKNNVLQICENRISKSAQPIANIPITLTGTGPFRINTTLTHDKLGTSETLIFDHVTEPNLELHYSESFGLGEHVLTINEIVDGNGCVRNDFALANNFVVIVTEVPNLVKAEDKYDYCVGDHISYNTTGVPPFTVYYNFRNKQQKAHVETRFTRLASKPGKLFIEALHDSSANQCKVDFTLFDKKIEELTLEVHDLPSVEVQKGNYIVEDIHEGEQTELIFTFEGVLPFTLTYVRTNEGSGEQVKKIIETFTIKDIWEFEYIATASLAGSYEAIEVKDRYCRAVRDIGL
jgi:nucleoporin POM152